MKQELNHELLICAKTTGGRNERILTTLVFAVILRLGEMKHQVSVSLLSILTMTTPENLGRIGSSRRVKTACEKKDVNL